MGNEALKTNRVVFRHADLEITTRGSDWLFAVCSIMCVSCFVVIAHSFTRPHNQRLFHQLTALILFVAAIAYFTMGSNLGQVPIQTEFIRHNNSQVAAAGTREIFYVRYIDWVITTPLLLTDLMLTAAMPWNNIIAIIIADEVMIITGLIGALVQTSYKWGYWTFGMVAFSYVVYSLVIVGAYSASILGGAVKRTYYICGVLTIGVWFLYPVAWGLCEGGNVIHPDSEAIFYGILDVFAKPVFGFLLLWGHRNIKFSTLGLNIPAPGHPHMREKEDVNSGGHNDNGGHAGVLNGINRTTAA